MSTDDYKKLKKLWYQKLKTSGFEDAESSEHHLKVWSSQFARKKSVLSWEAKAAYYHMANAFLNAYKFESDLERIIWEYHSNAISVRNITKLLKKVQIHTNRMTVWRTVNKLENKMKEMYLIGNNE